VSSNVYNLDGLLEDRQFTKAFLNSLPVGVLIIQDAERIIAANSVIEKILNLSADDLVDKSVEQALGCAHVLTHSKESPKLLGCPNCDNEEACGSLDNCIYCEIKSFALSALEKSNPIRDLIQMKLVMNGRVRNITLKIHAVPYAYRNTRLTTVLLDDMSALKDHPYTRERGDFHGIITKDVQMLRILDVIEHVAKTDLTVLIMGESGTGKELVARAIHKNSINCKGHFVPFNCGALPQGVVESELFGHVKGAFTGAHRDKKGRFELAHRGTLFMDEIAELTPALQVKLLRVLQDFRFERVGGETTIRPDTRIIAATNKNLEEETAAGRFREDLFYRLSVVPITLPPLRDRNGDIALLADHFLNRYSYEMYSKRISISGDALGALLIHDWPGNIRELQNAIKHSLINSRGRRIEMKHLPVHLLPSKPSKSKLVPRKTSLHLSDIHEAMKKTGGNKRQAARLLGISRSTLYRHLRALK